MTFLVFVFCYLLPLRLQSHLEAVVSTFKILSCTNSKKNGRLETLSKSSNMAAQGRGKPTAKGAVLSPEKLDFTVLLTNFAFIVTFEEFLLLYSKQSFYKCLINLSGPAGRYYRRKQYRPTAIKNNTVKSRFSGDKTAPFTVSFPRAWAAILDDLENFRSRQQRRLLSVWLFDLVVFSLLTSRK